MCPSPPPFGIGLGPTNPSLIFIAKETLVFRRAGLSPALRLLVPTFSLPYAPPWVTPLASSRTERSPTAYEFHRRPNMSFFILHVRSVWLGRQGSNLRPAGLESD